MPISPVSVAVPRAAPAFLPGLSIGRRAQAVERGLRDRPEVAGITVVEPGPLGRANARIYTTYPVLAGYTIR